MTWLRLKGAGSLRMPRDRSVKAPCTLLQQEPAFAFLERLKPQLALLRGSRKQHLASRNLLLAIGMRDAATVTLVSHTSCGVMLPVRRPALSSCRMTPTWPCKVLLGRSSRSLREVWRTRELVSTGLSSCRGGGHFFEFRISRCFFCPCPLLWQGIEPLTINQAQGAPYALVCNGH